MEKRIEYTSQPSNITHISNPKLICCNFKALRNVKNNFIWHPKYIIVQVMEA